MTAFCNDLSARNRRWAVRSLPDFELPEIAGVPREVVEIIARRGVTDIQEYLRPSLRGSMPNPSVLLGMDDAVGRFCAAIEAREKIAVFGDYDVDGATSTALIIRYLAQIGVPDAIFYIPQRLTEGYGPNAAAMGALRERGAQVVVIVDSGTTAFEPINHAVAVGLDVLVLDHHEPKEDGSLPPALVVNPKRVGEDGSLSYLCTAGLAFMFLVAVNRRLRTTGFFARTGLPEPDLRDLLGIVALGTVADVVPLRGLNRAFVRLGLSMMDRVLGIRALVNATGEAEFSARTCGFVFGPCINAGGRIADTMQGARLLTTEDPDEAHAIAETLFETNAKRQLMQKEMVANCIRRVEEANTDDRVIVVYDQEWHPGVVGLGASKVKDHFDKSAVVIGTDGKGSGRSVDGFNIGKAFIKAGELGLLKKGGGHAAAGGLTIDPRLVPEFREFMNEQARDFVHPPSQIDLAVPVGGLARETIEAFEVMAPFGMGNARPRIAVTGGVLTDTRIVGKGSLKGKLVGDKGAIDMILFGAVGSPLGETLIRAEGHYVDLMGAVDINTYGGASTIQIKPEDAMVGAAATALAATAA